MALATFETLNSVIAKINAHNEKHGGALFSCEAVEPLGVTGLLVRFQASVYRVADFRWRDIEAGIKAKSKGAALPTSSETLFLSGIIKIAVNAKDENFSFAKIIQTIYWLDEYIGGWHNSVA